VTWNGSVLIIRDTNCLPKKVSHHIWWFHHPVTPVIDYKRIKAETAGFRTQTTFSRIEHGQLAGSSYRIACAEHNGAKSFVC
jgi:hypothetical protein